MGFRIQPCDAFEQMNPSIVERQAVVLRWQMLPERPELIPSSDAVRLLLEIRQRQADAEQFALEMLRAKLSEGRRTPRRHQLFAFLLLAVLVVMAAIVLTAWPRL